MSSSNFDVLQLAGRIGAEIVGLDLSAPFADGVIADVRKALVRHKVIFFRDQKLDADAHVAFARRFGPLTTAHPTVPALQNNAHILDLDYGRSAARANVWHTDVTFVERPPFGSVLRALVIPPYGGDTLWSNTAAAYQDLPAPLRALADQLTAVHSNAYDYAVTSQLPEDVKAYRAVFESTVYETVHPLVHVHPESGERALLIGGFVRQIRDLSVTESADLLRSLQAHVTRPENTVRWRWRVGDVAFWDNRATQHYAIADYGMQPRHVQRVTIAGDVPVSISGQKSRALKGDASKYSPLAA
jgi:alpha-ketoglutarate-dependent sulfate ester dioxygenase